MLKQEPLIIQFTQYGVKYSAEFPTSDISLEDLRGAIDGLLRTMGYVWDNDSQ